MKTLVLGASTNNARYSNLAIRMLREYEHETVAIGLREGRVEDVEIETDRISHSGIHTVTLYLNPARQEEFYNYVLGLSPKRIIFNPGTENVHFQELARKRGIETLDACTLVMLRSNQY